MALEIPNPWMYEPTVMNTNRFPSADGEWESVTCFMWGILSIGDAER